MLSPSDGAHAGRTDSVEDDDSIRRLLVEYLEGHAAVPVDAARDGVEALHKISRGNYSVVILDLMMPKMSGADLLDSLNAATEDNSFLSLPKPPPVVIITSTPERDLPDETLLRRCGMVREVFRKPVDARRLARAIAPLIGGSEGRNAGGAQP